MAKKKITYTAQITVAVELSDADQRSLFNDVFYAVMSYTKRTAAERDFWQYVMDYDLQDKLWTVMSPQLKKAFTDMLVGVEQTLAHAYSLFQSVEVHDEMELELAHHKKFREWIEANCGQLLTPMVQKLKDADAKEEARRMKSDLQRAMSMIPILEKAGFSISKSAKKTVSAPAKKVKAK